ncbi:MAG: hypothetical protein H0W18_10450 [Acidobacteria bacterium]|nr:hypothetical protein [Acidobacteriota bacterium]
MGLRLALGASRWSPVRLLLRGALIPLAAGIVAGTAIAVAVTRAMAGLLTERQGSTRRH